MNNAIHCFVLRNVHIHANMEKLKVLVSVFLTLWKCEELIMQNVTFHNIQKTWKDAANACFDKGGILESNVTLLREHDEIKTSGKGVWIGKFIILTNWTYIRGCYLINGHFQQFELELSNSVELQCQMLCNEYKFYSIKGEDCFCIEDINSFIRSTNCNCVGCYKVWEHRLPDFGTTDREGKCIATDGCDSGKLRRSYVNCNFNFYVTCDNDADLGYTYSNYKAASEECERQGSFIKWYSDSLCDSPGRQPKHWTSGTRHDETFVMRKAYFTDILQPDKCFILSDDVVEKKKNCNDRRFFFCRFATDEDKGDIISIPNLSIIQQNSDQSDDSGSIAAGTASSIVALVVAVLVYLILRRRLSKEKPPIHEPQHSCPVQNLEELHINNEISQAAVFPEIDGGNFSPQYEILNRYAAVNSTSYDCLNLSRTPESENMYINTNNSAISISDSTETDSTFYMCYEQKERLKQKKQNAISNSFEVELDINHEPDQAAAYHEIDNEDLSPQYEKLNNVPAVNSTPYDCLNLERIPESENCVL